MATRSGQSSGEAVPNNVGFTTTFTDRRGHVEVPEWTSGRSCVLCFALLSLDAFLARFVPCPSAATPCSSLTCAVAGVAVLSTPLATTGQRALIQGCSGVQRGRRKTCHKPLRERHGTEMVWLSGALAVALKRARRRKEQTYPERVQPGARAKLVPSTSLMRVSSPNRACACVKVRSSKSGTVLMRVSRTAFMRVSRTAVMRVSPNASTDSATELASLAYLCSLRSHVF